MSKLDSFLAALAQLPTGYFRGTYKGNSWGATVERLSGGRQTKLYGEELGGADHVSFNLYQPSSGKILLKPCEMPSEKVIAFVEGIELEH